MVIAKKKDWNKNLLSLILLILLFFLVFVALLKEAGEEDEKKDSMPTNPPGKYRGKATFGE